MELTLETPRLRVRPFRGEDEAALAEILGDPAVMASISPPIRRSRPAASWPGQGWGRRS